MASKWFFLTTIVVLLGVLVTRLEEYREKIAVASGDSPKIKLASKEQPSSLSPPQKPSILGSDPLDRQVALANAKVVSTEKVDHHIEKIKSLGSLVDEDVEKRGDLIIRQQMYRVPDAKPILIVRSLERLRTTATEKMVLVGNEFVIKILHARERDTLGKLKKDFGFKVQKMLLGQTYLVTYEKPTLNKFRRMKKLLQEMPGVEIVEENVFGYNSAVPNDPLLNQLWGIKNPGGDIGGEAYLENFDSNVFAAWEKKHDCSGIDVAVLDTGIDPNHPDLMTSIDFDQARGFVPMPNSSFVDENGHGTHVAGIIGAIGNNGIGIAGICWKVKIIPIKVINTMGGTRDAFINGVIYAASTTAKVINMSVSYDQPSSLQLEALEMLAASGKVIVTSAGNKNMNTDTVPHFPSTFASPAVIAVAALDGQGNIAPFSNFGAQTVDIAAPGQGILSTTPGYPTASFPTPGGYNFMSGTSMAAPFVAGSLALLWSYSPGLTVNEIRDALLRSAKSKGFLKPVGGGRFLDAGALMDLVRADISLQGGADAVITLENASKIPLSFEYLEDFTSIEEVAIYFNDTLIKSFTDLNSVVDIDIPTFQKDIELTVKLTDAGGNITERQLDFVLDLTHIPEINLETLAAEGQNCSVKRELPQETPKEIFSVSLVSQTKCQVFCLTYGPAFFTTLGDIVCGDGETEFYRSRH